VTEGNEGRNYKNKMALTSRKCDLLNDGIHITFCGKLNNHSGTMRWGKGHERVCWMKAFISLKIRTSGRSLQHS
jgi:hypothetical protein